MSGRLQEHVAWTRLQDMQREMENHRLYGGGIPLRRTVAMLLRRIWLPAGLAGRRAPRRSPAARRRESAL